MKRHSILFIIIIFAFKIDAQSIKRQSINSFGNSGKADSVSIHQSVGQSYSTSSQYDSKSAIRPGFQQPESFFIKTEELILLSLDVFPNPSAYSFTIKNDEELSEAHLIITDIMGKSILNKSIQNFTTETVNCSHWANGTYIITLKSKNSKLYSSKLIISK